MQPNIKKYTFKQGLPQEFEIIGIADLYKEFEDTLTTPHRTGFYHIIWFQEGSPIHLVDFNPVQIKPNTLLFLNKDIVHRFDKNGNFDGKVILFTDSFFCKTENDARFLQSSILFNDFFSVSQIEVQTQSKLFTDLLQQMTDELQNIKDNFQADILQNQLHNFLLYSERERVKKNWTEIQKGTDLDYVMLFKNLLEKEYKSQKQVKYYAKEISINEKRLNLATAKILGKIPKEIIDDRIMLEAKRILAHTTESVKEIAFKLGFEEPTNFIKYFKKHSLITPLEFRKKNTFP